MQLCGTLSIFWHCLSLGLEWKLTFPSPVHCWVFQICWHIESSTFTASSFRIWNSSTGIPSLPLALFIVLLPKPHLTSHSRMSGSRSASESVLPMTIQSWYPRIDWFDLAVQGTLKSFLKHHSSKALILWHSAFFIVQLSHPYMTAWKTIALTRQTFVGNVSVF